MRRIVATALLVVAFILTLAYALSGQATERSTPQPFDTSQIDDLRAQDAFNMCPEEDHPMWDLLCGNGAEY